jgi:hypothetical protein
MENAAKLRKNGKFGQKTGDDIDIMRGQMEAPVRCPDAP